MRESTLAASDHSAPGDKGLSELRSVDRSPWFSADEQSWLSNDPGLPVRIFSRWTGGESPSRLLI
jgi:hypothetical protein